mmetsp:Transcript_2641/g.5489  ORF Transcript_2641/g.5489 Transcript_2641/m.5489 type:complete len:222 (+) Transcript_2641:240-905(+)
MEIVSNRQGNVGVQGDRNSDGGAANLIEVNGTRTDGNINSESGSRSSPIKYYVNFLLSRAKLWGPIFAVSILMGALVKAFFSEEFTAALEYLQDNQPESLLYFTLVFVVWVLLCLSKSIMVVAGGYIYGIGLSLLCSVIGMVLASMCSYLVVKTLCNCTFMDARGKSLRERLKDSLIQNYVEMRAVQQMMKERPYRSIFLIRMTYIPTWSKTLLAQILQAW